MATNESVAWADPTAAWADPTATGWTREPRLERAAQWARTIAALLSLLATLEQRRAMASRGESRRSRRPRSIPVDGDFVRGYRQAQEARRR